MIFIKNKENKTKQKNNKKELIHSQHHHYLFAFAVVERELLICFHKVLFRCKE